MGSKSVAMRSPGSLSGGDSVAACRITLRVKNSIIKIFKWPQKKIFAFKKTEFMEML